MLYLIGAICVLAIFLMPSGPAGANGGITSWWPCLICLLATLALAILSRIA